MLNRKMYAIKKGGYTLFKDKAINMLWAVGISLFSVCSLANVADAKPVAGKSYDNGELYQISAIEDSETYKLDKVLVNDQEVSDNDKVFWKMSNDGKELLAVIKVTDTNPEITVKNNDAREEKSKEELRNEILEKHSDWQKKGEGEDPSSSIEVAEDHKDDLDKAVEEALLEASKECKINCEAYDDIADGPQLKWAYKNEEENYVQFKVEDEIVISKIVDDNGCNINLEEKDQGTSVIAKYVLDKGTKFDIENVFGKKQTVAVDDIDVTYTIAAKNVDGKRIVLNISLPEKATLDSLKTVDGIDILVDEATIVEKGDEGDRLVAIYTNVPEGTTYVDLTYTPNGGTARTIPIALKLDLKAPELVQRDADGKKVDANGTARVYKNETGTKALVEVSDMLSGIVKIAVYKNTEECKEATQKFDIKDLPTSVLQLMDLPVGATNIKIFDGMGNVRDIHLEDVSIDDGAGLSLDIELDENKLVATYQDKKAGLHKFVRAKADNALSKTVRSNYEANYAPDNLYQTIQDKQDIEAKYSVKEDTKDIAQNDWQGSPEFTALSVLGNKEEFNINSKMFEMDSIYMATSGDKDNPVVKAMAVKVHDARRIKKITADINGEEKVLDTFETGTISDTSNIEEDLLGPVDIDRVYELPEGAHVTKVTFYHYNGDVTQNEIPVDFTSEESPIIEIPEVVEQEEEPGVEPSGEEPGEDPRQEFVEIEIGGGEMIMPGVDGQPTIEIPVVTTKIKYGIKKIEYSDGCVLEFYEDLPKEVEVYTRDDKNEPLEWVYITDGLGYRYNVADGSGDIAKFAPEGEETNTNP